MKSNTQREQNVERGSDDENIREKPWKKIGKNNDYKSIHDKDNSEEIYPLNESNDNKIEVEFGEDSENFKDFLERKPDKNDDPPQNNYEIEGSTESTENANDYKEYQQNAAETPKINDNLNIYYIESGEQVNYDYERADDITTKETLSSIIPTSSTTASSAVTADANVSSTATVDEETTDETAIYDNLFEEAIATERTEPPTNTEEFLKGVSFILNFEEASTTTTAPESSPEAIVLYVEKLRTESFDTPATEPSTVSKDAVPTTLVSTLSGLDELATTMATTKNSEEKITTDVIIIIIIVHI